MYVCMCILCNYEDLLLEFKQRLSVVPLKEVLLTFNLQLP